MNYGSIVLSASVIGLALAPSATAREIPSTADIVFVEAVLGEAKVVSSFGVRTDAILNRRNWHGGIDLGTEWAAPVFAPAQAEVIYADSKAGYGKTVDLKVSDGWVVRMAHLSDIKVELGDRIDAGHILGEVGSTGPNVDPHLHLETRYNDKQYDPELIEQLSFYDIEKSGN